MIWGLLFQIFNPKQDFSNLKQCFFSSLNITTCWIQDLNQHLANISKALEVEWCMRSQLTLSEIMFTIHVEQVIYQNGTCLACVLRPHRSLLNTTRASKLAFGEKQSCRSHCVLSLSYVLLLRVPLCVSKRPNIFCKTSPRTFCHALCYCLVWASRTRNKVSRKIL